ncbi:hypothetical protein Tco_0502491, partial [Tanacetum coccineum]
VDSQNTPTFAPSTSQPTSTTPIITLETSPSKIISSPSLSSPTQQTPPSIDTTHDAKDPATMPHDSPLQRVQSLGRDKGSMTLSELTVLCTNLSNKVTSLEADLAQTKQTYGTSLTKLIKKVKKLEQTVKSTQARRRFRIVVSDDEEGEASDDTEVVLEEEKPTKLVEDQGSGEKGEKEVSTIGAEHSIIILEIDEEERQRIARDAEIAKQLQKEINKATQEQKKQEVGGYKMRHFKGMSYEDIRPIFEKVWDQIHSFVPMDSKLEIPKLKRAEPVKRQSTKEEKKRDDSSKPAEGRRKKTLARKRASGKDSEESMKKQMLEDDTEKEDLKAYLDIIPGDDVAIDIESLGTKYPIVDWKTYVLAKNFMYYQIFRADGSSKNYKIFSMMLDDFKRQDVLDLHKLAKARYMTLSPEGYDLMLWGDLKTLFEPDDEDEV